MILLHFEHSISFWKFSNRNQEPMKKQLSSRKMEQKCQSQNYQIIKSTKNQYVHNTRKKQRSHLKPRKILNILPLKSYPDFFINKKKIYFYFFDI